MREMEMTKRHSSARTMVLFACISVLIIGLFACDDRKDGSSAHSGKLRLSLTADTTSLKKGVNSNLTKAVSDEFEKFLTVEDYQIRIVTDKDTVKSYDRFDKMPSEIELPEGAYTIVASKGNDLPAAFENPYFEGSTAFTVKDGMSTRLDMTCTLGNARVTVESTDDFNKVYTDYSVDLKTVLMDTVFRIKKDEVRPAYLQVVTEGTDTNITVYVKKAGDTDSTAFHVQTPLKLERRQNVRLILKLSDGNQGVGLDVMLDDELTYLPVDTKIPEYMYKPMGDAELRPIHFEDGDEKETRPGSYDGNAIVHFNMQGGVSSLAIKITKDNEDPDIFDITTTEGAAVAAAKNFKWSKTDDPEKAVTDPVTEKWMEGYIFLGTAINSLEAPLAVDETYLYKFEFSGKDATGKEHESNNLTYNIIMQNAGAPIIIEKGSLPLSIVEGDELSDEVEYVLEASGLIDKDVTSLTINEQAYNLSTDATTLKDSYGINTRFDSEAKAVITFTKSFSAMLTAPDAGSKDYKFVVTLKDKNGKEKFLEKVISVYAPVFTFDTNEGAAFAKRVVLHGTIQKGDPKKLNFICNGTVANISDIVLDDQTYQAVLAGLEPNSSYTLQAKYNNKDNRKSQAVTVTTEEANTFVPNAGFEEWSIAPDANGSILEGAPEPSGLGKSPNDPPGRFWEIWQPWTGEDTKGWNTNNAYTTQDGGFSISSWMRYVATSAVIKEAGKDGSASLVRTVGWGSGSTAALTSGNMGTVKNCTPGELYLDMDVKDTRFGKDIISRPTALSFDYKYVRKNKDTFIAKLTAWNQNGDVITNTVLEEGLATPTETWSNQKLVVNYSVSSGLMKAERIRISFISGTSTSKDDLLIYPSGSNLTRGEYVGSQLYIDNVELIYE